jgi:hypothetical protein
MMKLLPVLGLSMLWTGCVTSHITNLTPSAAPRTPSGQYLVEMAIDHRQHTIRDESITPYAVVGFDSYRMVRTPKVANRWETYIPVPADKDSVNYYFKVLYQYNKFAGPSDGSRLSQEYKLTIED